MKGTLTKSNILEKKSCNSWTHCPNQIEKKLSGWNKEFSSYILERGLSNAQFMPIGFPIFPKNILWLTLKPNCFMLPSVCQGISSLNRLNKHKVIHTKEKSCRCSLCDKGFSCSSKLKTHMVVHTGGKLFPCSVCDKRFSRSSNLKIHMMTHSGEKPFSCSLCDKGFSCPSKLKRHMMIHTGVKPFRCALCGKRFPDSSSLERHMVQEFIEKSRIQLLDCNWIERNELLRDLVGTLVKMTVS